MTGLRRTSPPAQPTGSTDYLKILLTVVGLYGLVQIMTTAFRRRFVSIGFLCLIPAAILSPSPYNVGIVLMILISGPFLARLNAQQAVPDGTLRFISAFLAGNGYGALVLSLFLGWDPISIVWMEVVASSLATYLAINRGDIQA